MQACTPGACTPGNASAAHHVCIVAMSHYKSIKVLPHACRGQHEAKRLGAALISRNIADILLENFQEHGKQLRVLVYCWRGGERSQSLAHVLSRVGWEVAIVKRGYMGYRVQVPASASCNECIYGIATEKASFSIDTKYCLSPSCAWCCCGADGMQQ